MLMLHCYMHILDVPYEGSEAKAALQAPVLQSRTVALSSDPREPSL